MQLEGLMQYISIALLAFAGFIIIFNIVKGLIRGLKKTVGSLVAIIISALIAWLITAIVCRPSSLMVAKVMELLQSVLPEGEIRDLLLMESLGDAINHYSAMIAAPVFFTACYIVISIVVSIVIAIVIKFIPPKKEESKLVKRLCGSAVGLVCGFLVVVLTLMPTIGTFELAVNAASELESETAEETSPDEYGIHEFLEVAKNDTTIKILGDLGCRPLYNMLASTSFDGERVYLKNDISAILAMLDNVTLLGGDMSGYSYVQIEAIDEIINSFDSSPLIKHAVAGVFSTVSTTWLDGGAFMGIEKITAGEMIDPVIDGMLEVMQTSDKNNISADLRTMRDVFAILVENEVLAYTDNSEALLEKLGEGEVISELMAAVTSNERMLPLADAVTEVSIRALASVVGIPGSNTEIYDALMTDLAAAVNNVSGVDADYKYETLVPEVEEALGNYGIKVSGEALNNVAQSLLSDLGNKGTVTAEDVSELFAVYAVAQAEGEDSASLTGKSFDMLSSESVSFVDNGDGTVSINGKVLKNYSAESLRNSSAYKMGRYNNDFGNAATLMSPETMVTDIMTMDTIMSLLGKYGECEDVEAEAKKIGDFVSSALTIFSDVDIENANIEDIVARIGVLLDGMNGTEILGGDTTEALLTALMQSDLVSGQFGLSKEEITEFASKMAALVNDSGKSYEYATKTVADTIKMFTTAMNADATAQDKKEATKELLSNITPESADMISSMVTTSMVTDMGVPEEKAEAVTSTLSSMLGKMADYSSENADEESINKEVEAVNKVVDMAMNITDTTSEPLFHDDENGESLLGNADEFVDLIVNSEVISGTLQEAITDAGNTDNPLGIPTLSASDAAMAESALQSYYDANGGGEDLAAKLEAIAAMVNLNVNLD